MPDKMLDYAPEWTYDENLVMREPIVKLGKMITDRVPIVLGMRKITPQDPEYWAVHTICPTDEMAEVALRMKKRHPRTWDDMKKIVANMNISDEHLKELLDQMSENGLIEWNYENPQHEKQWVLPMFVPGSGEFSNMNHELLEKHPELGYFFERMTRNPLEKITPMVPPGGGGIGMHVIPVEKAIEMENEAIGIEKISHWLDKYDGKYAASPCSCRYSRKTYGEGCADDPEGWCVAMGDMADYVVETKKGGHYITREQALEIFKQGEENGFVHQITNIDGEDKIFAICNCNVNVCYALRTSQLFNTPNMSRSAYVAHVKKENCVACGRCVEHCPAGALKLGQKLCKKDGSEVEYPRQELPDAVKWGPEKWEPEYRDKNRINSHETGTAPCKTACPAHIAIQGYLKMAAQGRYEDALALIKKENPFPAVCGHVCNKRCEEACTRGTIDEAIAIDDVKKFLAHRDMDNATRLIPKKVIPKITVDGVFDREPGFTEKVAIIGAGPAGLSCAFFLAEKGYLNVTVFEKNEEPGGMLRYGIPNYKLEKEVINAEIDIIREMGVEIKCGVEVGKDITLDELRAQGYKAFYMAIGAQGGRKAGVDGEDAQGVITAVEFLHAAAEKEAYDIGEKVVVVGGGNVAIDAARVSVHCGAKEVSMYCLESRDEMPASDDEVEEALEDGATINNGWGPKEIVKDENGKVKAIVFKKCVSVFDDEHRFAPVYDENDTVTVECNNVILSIGQAIEWGGLLEGSAVELNRNMTAKADTFTFQTAQPDVFVGGDAFTGPRFAIDAIAMGKEGAISIHRFVQPNSTLTIGRNPRYYVELDKDDIKVEGYDTAHRQIPTATRKVDPKGFKDDCKLLSEEQVKIETSRCLGCGATIVDPNRCVGCGVCTTKCEFEAIELHRDRPECSTMYRAEDKLKAIFPYMIKREFAIKKANRNKK
ncbi:MAG: FAD-dependent oxidoreductase [Ruminococcaceae bacterium]|nr:FAD-dependent oxidoreductase [Oscillospiraceae bacterium]